MARRTIVVGDIHGCYDELIDLLDVVKLKKKDRVISVGDLIIKGEKSREVLDLFIKDERFSAVVGNHDRAIRQFWRGEPIPLSDEQKVTCAELDSKRKKYLKFLRSLPYMIDLGTHLVVHAGVRPGVPLEHQMAADLTELRTMGANPSSRKGIPWYAVYRGEKVVIFGHWPGLRPRVAPRAIGLDTACVYGRRLTGYIIETHTFVSVPARRTYVRLKRILR